jgi:hypothetical protein
MQFTHYTPGHIPYNTAGSTPETLQIISIKLVEIAGGLEFPLSVYGVVAVRDTVDGSRNILFRRRTYKAQQLKQNVCVCMLLIFFSCSALTPRASPRLLID